MSNPNISTKALAKFHKDLGKWLQSPEVKGLKDGEVAVFGKSKKKTPKPTKK
jgi:hypothetical protein